jgi:hypothetical protein
LLDGLVGDGEPTLVLAEVFFPSGDPELFDEPVTAVGVSAMPRAITQRGMKSCSSATNVETVLVQARPANTSTTNVTAKIGTRTSNASAAAKTTPATDKVAFVDRNRRARPRTSAPRSRRALERRT